MDGSQLVKQLYSDYVGNRPSGRKEKKLPDSVKKCLKENENLQRPKERAYKEYMTEYFKGVHCEPDMV